MTLSYDEAPEVFGHDFSKIEFKRQLGETTVLVVLRSDWNRKFKDFTNICVCLLEVPFKFVNSDGKKSYWYVMKPHSVDNSDAIFISCKYCVGAMLLGVHEGKRYYAVPWDCKESVV